MFLLYLDIFLTITTTVNKKQERSIFWLRIAIRIERDPYYCSRFGIKKFLR
jgi:hypothetical protein